jgi:hypothetical protein
VHERTRREVDPGVAIYTRTLPVCTDLRTIGAGTVVQNEALISCYQAHNGKIQTGPVHLGNDVFVGEAWVVDTGTSWETRPTRTRLVAAGGTAGARR